MASVDRTEADQLDHCAKQPSVVSSEQFVTDELYSRLQVKYVDGGCWAYPMAELPTGYDFIEGSDPIVAAAGTYPLAENRVDTLRYMAAMVELNGDIANNLNINSVLMDQILLVVRGMQLAIEAQLYDPLSVAAPAPTNLPAFVDRSAIPWFTPRDPNGYLQIADMGCMAMALSPADPKAADYFVVSQAVRNEIYDLYRADGMGPPMKEDPLNPGVNLPTAYDIPVLASNHIKTEPDGTYRMYLVRLANGADETNKSMPLVRLAPAENVVGGSGDPADFQITRQRPDSGVADVVQVDIRKSVAYSAGSDYAIGARGIKLRNS